MPQNIFIKLGVIVLVATALLWAGAQLSQRVEWILPYSAGVSVVLIVLGVIYEIRKKKPSPTEPSV